MEVARWIAFLVCAWVLPGVVVARFLRAQLELPAATTLAIAWIAAPVGYGLLAIPLGALGVSPVVPAAVMTLGGLVFGLRPAVWAEWRRVVTAAPLVFATPLVIAGFVALAGDPLGMQSDSYAHVAAVRSTIEESAIFPVRGFHGDDLSRGADPRFGTLHALYGVAAIAGGSDVLRAWDLAHGIGAGVMVSGGLALLAVMATSPTAIALGLLALLATTGGAHYDALAVAAYPLWFSMGIIWTLCATVIAGSGDRPRASGVLAGFTLGALVGVHFFALILGGFMLAVLVVVAGRRERAAGLAMLGVAGALALPFVALRFVTSYANANPIHQKPWQCMRWSEGLYSVSPVYLFQWLFPFGLAALVWALLRTRALRADLRFRWLMVVALLTLVWTLVPWLLTPSMELLGFLPLRLYMAIGTPFLIALLVDRQMRARGTVVALLVAVLALPLFGRATAMLDDARRTGAASESFAEMLEALPVDGGARVVLVSDPYTMMAVRAVRDVDVVAVPDGRSSPRDPEPIERLRDSWRIMSPAVGGEPTAAALRRRGVTHVVVNTALPSQLASYEYPTGGIDSRRQIEKFLANGAHFEVLWRDQDLILFAAHPVDGEAWSESYLAPCAVAIPTAVESVVEVGPGYRLVEPVLTLRKAGEGYLLRIAGTLVWTGANGAPDRQLVVRMDRTPPRISGALVRIGKPLRKLREMVSGEIDRYRWTTYPGDGRCPTWLAGESGPVALDLELALPAGVAAGEYRVSLAARDRSIFEPVRPADLFLDDDSMQGPTLGVVAIP